MRSSRVAPRWAVVATVLFVGAASVLGCGSGSDGKKKKRGGCKIQSITPNIGVVAGGETITITGSGFEAGMQVIIGTTEVPSITVVDSETVTFFAPQAPIEMVVDVSVILPNGRICTLEDGYTYDGPCLQSPCGGCLVNTFEPSEGPVEGGTWIRVIGAGFQSGVEVAFGTTLAQGIVFLGAGPPYNDMLVESPPSPIAGTFEVTVFNPGGSVCMTPTPFTYGTGCAIASVVPSQACAYFPERITITGSGFQPGADVELEASLQPTTTAPKVDVIDENTIEFLTPDLLTAVGVTYDVRVVNPDGSTCFIPSALTITIQPPAGSCSISGVSPNAGSLQGGEIVTITGSGFTLADRVFFGFEEAQVVTPGMSTIEVIAPPGVTAETVLLKVTDPSCIRPPCLSTYTYQ